jgi:hypothetical protein
VDDESIPFGRWGRVTAPEPGSYLYVERETPAGWKKQPPKDAVRVSMRRPGEPDDSDYNWSTCLHETDLPEWLSRFAIDEWLEPGAEPDWS